jgi:hypothetical protein
MEFGLSWSNRRETGAAASVRGLPLKQDRGCVLHRKIIMRTYANV